MHTSFSSLLLTLLFAATSTSVPSNELSLVKRQGSYGYGYSPSPQPQINPQDGNSFDNGNCGPSHYLQNGVSYMFQLGPWGPDPTSRLLSGCWACFGQSGQAGQGWQGTAGSVMRDTVNNVNWYNKWKVTIPDPTDNRVMLSISGDGQTLYMGPGTNMHLPDGDPRAFAVINDVQPVALRYILTPQCNIRFYDDQKGTLGRCGAACENYNVQYVDSKTEAMHFWGSLTENNQVDRPPRVDFTAIKC